MQHHIFVLAIRLFPLSVVSSVVIQVLAPVFFEWPRYRPLLPAFDALMSMLFPICFHDSASRTPNEVILELRIRTRRAADVMLASIFHSYAQSSVPLTMLSL